MPLIKDPADAANVFTVKTSHYLIAGMSLATALSWNEAIKRVIDNTYPMPHNNTQAVILYSVVMTLMLILIIWLLPDTKAELPLDVQHRMHRAEIEDHRREMHRLQLEIQRMRIEMDHTV
jgi:hypothetical protein